MEHIRSAIEKARQEREAAQAARPAIRDGDTQATPPVVSRWDALNPVDLKLAHLKRNLILSLHANSGSAPYDVLRTNLLHEMRKHGWRRVAITSPSAECGRTTLCLNLGLSLARQPDLKVMMIELDLRRPAMARKLGLQEPTEFAQALAGREPPENHIVRIGSNLAAATSHTRAGNPAELLQSVTAANVIDELEAEYEPDIMVFDMPPMLVADDTLAFIDQIDCVLLIGAAESSSVDEIGRCKQDIEARTNLLGVVLNKCRYLDSTEGYHYGDY